MPGALRFQGVAGLQAALRSGIRQRSEAEARIGMVGADVFPVPAFDPYRDLVDDLQRSGILALVATPQRKYVLEQGLAHLAYAWLAGAGSRCVLYPMTWPSDGRLVNPGNALADEQTLIIVNLGLRESMNDAWREAPRLAQARRLVVAGSREEVDLFLRRAHLDQVTPRVAPDVTREALFPAVRWMAAQGTNGNLAPGRLAALAGELRDGRPAEQVYSELAGDPQQAVPVATTRDHEYWAILAHLHDVGLERAGVRRADKVPPALLTAAWQSTANGAPSAPPPPPQDLAGRRPPGFQTMAFCDLVESQPDCDEGARHEVERLRLFDALERLDLKALGRGFERLRASGKDAVAINDLADILALFARRNSAVDCLGRLAAIRQVPIAAPGDLDLANLSTALAGKLAKAGWGQELLVMLATTWVNDDLATTLDGVIRGGRPATQHARVLRAAAVAVGSPDDLPQVPWFPEETQRLVRARLENSLGKLDESGLWLLARLGGTRGAPEARGDALRRLLPQTTAAFTGSPSERQGAWRNLKTFLSDATAGDPAMRRQALQAIDRLGAERLATLPPVDVLLHQSQYVLSSLTKLDLTVAQAFGRAITRRALAEPKVWSTAQADSLGYFLSNLVEANLEEEARKSSEAILAALRENGASLVAHVRFPSLLNQLSKAAGPDAVRQALDAATPFLAKAMVDWPGDVVDDALVHFMGRRDRLVALRENNVALRAQQPFRVPPYGLGPRRFILHWIDERTPQRGKESFVKWGWVPDTPEIHAGQIDALLAGRPGPDGRTAKFEGLQAKAYAIARLAHQQWEKAWRTQAGAPQAFRTMEAVLAACARARLEWVPIHIGRTGTAAWSAFEQTRSSRRDVSDEGLTLEAVASVVAKPEQTYPVPLDGKNQLHVALSTAWKDRVLASHAVEGGVKFRLTPLASEAAASIQATQDLIPIAGASAKVVLQGADERLEHDLAKAIRRGLVTWSFRSPQVPAPKSLAPAPPLEDFVILRRAPENPLEP